MASVFVHQKSPYWFARYKDENGRWRNKSTKVPAVTSFEKKAWLVALKWEEDAQRLQRGDFLRRHVEEGSRQIAERVFPIMYKQETVREFLTAWLSDKKVTTTKGTAVVYTSFVERFFSIMKERAEKPLTALSVEDLRHHRDALEKDGMAPESIRMHCKCIGGALASAVSQGKLQSNPFKSLSLPVDPSEDRKPFTVDEVRRLLAVAGEEWKSAILFGLCAGCRLGDSVSMRWSNVNLTEGTLAYTPDKQRRGKEGVLQVPLAFDLKEHLLNIQGKAVGEYVTPKLRNTPGNGRDGLSYKFGKLMEKAEISREQIARKRGYVTATKSFHSLRHTLPTLLARSGVSPEIRMKITGHKSGAVHARYTHLDISDQRKALDSLPSLFAGIVGTEESDL